MYIVDRTLIYYRSKHAGFGAAAAAPTRWYPVWSRKHPEQMSSHICISMEAAASVRMCALVAKRVEIYLLLGGYCVLFTTRCGACACVHMWCDELIWKIVYCQIGL